MIQYKYWFSVGLLSIALAGCKDQETPPESLNTVDIAITNTTLVDVSHGTRSNQTVLVSAGKIVDVVASSEIVPAAKKVIDGQGKFLIPGLWDMHVHITYEPDLTVAMPDLFLSYGITSVRDTGGLMANLTPEIEKWRAAGAVAPNIFFSGPLLDGSNVVYDGNDRPEIGIANSTTAIAETNIAALKAAGVDFVKLYELVSPEVFHALVKAARKAGLPIAAHVPLAVSAQEAGPLVDSMEHLRNVELGCASTGEKQLLERQARISSAHDISGYELRASLHAEHHPRARAAIDEQICDELAGLLKHTTQVPTLQLNTFAVYPIALTPGWFDHLAKLPAAVRDRWARQATKLAEDAPTIDPASGLWSLQLVKRLHKAGVPIGAGTDTPILFSIPGYSLHTELERLVEAGLSPLEALAAATVRPAEFFGISNTIGQIAPEQIADLVLLDANPLENISNTRSVRTVISRGRVVREF